MKKVGLTRSFGIAHIFDISAESDTIPLPGCVTSLILPITVRFAGKGTVMSDGFLKGSLEKPLRFKFHSSEFRSPSGHSYLAEGIIRREILNPLTSAFAITQISQCHLLIVSSGIAPCYIPSAVRPEMNVNALGPVTPQNQTSFHSAWSMASAAASRSGARMCPYTSAVIRMDACPRTSLTTWSLTPLASIRLAAE